MPYYSKETIETVKSISALQYMMDHERFNLKKVGSRYRMINHDSVDFNKGYFIRRSSGKGGRSAIDLLRVVYDMEFIEAVEHLCNLYNLKPEEKSFEKINYFKKRNDEIQRMIDSQMVNEKRDFVLPAPSDNNKRVYAYLRKRGISDKVINYCINNKLLYQEAEHGNCVFVGYDYEGTARYTGLRSTGYKSFKGDATGSNKTYSFKLLSKESKTVHLFEAPIDLLSYATYMELEGYDFTKTNLLALAGIAIPRSDGETKLPDSIQALIDNKEIESFVIHFDNDIPGKSASKALNHILTKKGYKVAEISVPEEYGKDVNDFVQALLVNKTQKEMTK